MTIRSSQLQPNLSCALTVLATHENLPGWALKIVDEVDHGLLRCVTMGMAALLSCPSAPLFGVCLRSAQHFLLVDGSVSDRQRRALWFFQISRVAARECSFLLNQSCVFLALLR